MTEYELIDALNSTQEVTIAASMGFITLSSAYAIAIHLVGRTLPAFFLYGITIGYSAWSTLPMMGIHRSANEMMLLRAKLEALRSNLPIPEEIPAIYLNSAILGFFWFLCILYTAYIRRGA